MLMLDNLHQGQSHLPSGVLPSMSMYSLTKKRQKSSGQLLQGLVFHTDKDFSNPWVILVGQMRAITRSDRSEGLKAITWSRGPPWCRPILQGLKVCNVGCRRWDDSISEVAASLSLVPYTCVKGRRWGDQWHTWYGSSACFHCQSPNSR